MRPLLLVLALAGCARAEAHVAPEDPRVAVQLAPVARGPVPRPVRGTGILRLKREMDLSFKVGGVVASVLVDDGATVKRGQLLARLDPTEVEAALRQAKESSAKAERDLERTRKLHASGALAAVERENAETAFALATATETAARFDAQRAAIVAPDDGRIDRRLVESGEVVAPGRPIFHMSGRSKGAVVRIGVTDRDVLRLHEGDAATVTLDARPGVLPAKITQIATIASPTGTFDVEARVDEIDAPSGLTAKVEVPLAEEGTSVPIGAVSFTTAGAAVAIVRESRVHFVPVKTAFTAGDRVVLAPGELAGVGEVVEAGLGQVAENSPVKVVP